MEEYLNEVNAEKKYDVLLAIRPSGLTKDLRQKKHGDNIYIIELTYSEHSSYEELKRFVQYLKPKRVISTLPNSMPIPTEWYQYKSLHQGKRSYQPTMSSYLTKSTIRKNSKR